MEPFNHIMILPQKGQFIVIVEPKSNTNILIDIWCSISAVDSSNIKYSPVAHFMTIDVST